MDTLILKIIVLIINIINFGGYLSDVWAKQASLEVTYTYTVLSDVLTIWDEQISIGHALLLLFECLSAIWYYVLT